MKGNLNEKLLLVFCSFFALSIFTPTVADAHNKKWPLVRTAPREQTKAEKEREERRDEEVKRRVEQLEKEREKRRKRKKKRKITRKKSERRSRDSREKSKRR